MQLARTSLLTLCFAVFFVDFGAVLMFTNVLYWCCVVCTPMDVSRYNEANHMVYTSLRVDVCPSVRSAKINGICQDGIAKLESRPHDVQQPHAAHTDQQLGL